MLFEDLNLDPRIMSAIKGQGYTSPTPIQEQSIPAVLSGADVLAAAQTGTGKTAAFTLPLLQGLIKGHNLQNKKPRVLILTPTRELAAQVSASVVTYGSGLGMRSTVVFGGVSAKPQIKAFREGVDVLIATPGRLLDHANQGFIDLSKIEVLVLDEADRMLDMGFIRDIRKVLNYLPKKRQNLLFSATFSPEIRQMARGLLDSPVEVDVSPRNTTVERIEQKVVFIDKRQKRHLLCWMIKNEDWQQVLVFTRTKHGANRLCKQLEAAGLPSAALHGNKSQNARTKALSEFKAGQLRVLVATDIAARGIDIDMLPHVINYELPNVPEDYVHRIGRTGRAGREGEAVSLVENEERNLLKNIERLIKVSIPLLDISGFVPAQISETDKSEERPPRPQGNRRGNGGSNGRNRSASANKPSGPSRSASASAPKEGGAAKPRSRRRPSNNKPSGNR